MKRLVWVLSFFISLTSYADFLKVSPGEISGFEYFAQEEQRLHKAFTIIEKVINSEEFKSAVLKYPYYTNNNGLNNQQVYDFLMSGKELIDGEQTLNEMNFDVARYVPWYASAVIARTNPGSHNWIEVNGQHYVKMNSAEMAGNITHEWIHLMGFYHDSKNDSHSVPYAVGEIMKKLALKHL